MMIKNAISAVASIFIMLVCSSAFASAVLTDVQGNVTVSIQGKPETAAKTGMELPNGSVIKVGADSSAAVLLESGAVDQVAAGRTYAVGSKGAGAKRTDLGRGIMLAMRELSAQGEGPTVHGMVREAKGPSKKPSNLGSLKALGINAAFPVGTTVRLLPVLNFAWMPTPPMNWPKPALVIEDANDKRLCVFSLKEGTTSHAVDTRRAGLEAGKAYSWYLATQENGLKGKTMRFNFKTLSGQAENEMNASIAKIGGLGIGKDGTALLTAQAYYQHGLYDAMVKELLPVWQNRQTPFVRKLLYLGYTKMGQAEKAYQLIH